jgi:hypothetical protein
MPLLNNDVASWLVIEHGNTMSALALDYDALATLRVHADAGCRVPADGGLTALCADPHSGLAFISPGAFG